MAGLIMSKFDKLFNCFTLLLLVGGSMILHTLTALTFKSYYGDPWGYISFALPVLSEAYLVTIQLADEMYNFAFIFIAFILLALLSGATWLIKNRILHRLESLLENRQ